ncbi:MAG: tRNA (guanosine(46)-N7)-methyltransferase TrmB [Balneolaceae bacterium]|nr:tRNA (guanosine(46)-N7)-methyltransferase TrmB [Balneolaceae bacterium]
MPKVKKQRMREMKKLRNVLEYTDFEENHTSPKGKWKEEIFENENPIVLELACGKGEYSVGLAKLEENKNYLGIDIKGNRMWVGATTALEEGLENVRYFRAFIDHLPQFFEKGEIDEAWIIFPDPYIKKERKRLTSPKFLKTFRKVMAPDTVINLKTDSDLLYEYTKEVIAEQDLELVKDIDDVYKTYPEHPILSIKTYYENIHLSKGKTIKFLSFRLGE